MHCKIQTKAIFYNNMSRGYFPVTMLAIVLFIGIVLTGKYNLYTYFTSLDKILHFLGGFALAWLWHWLFHHQTARLSFSARLSFILGGVAIIGVGWEIAEFLANRSKDVWPVFYHYFHGGGLGDTLADMVSNLGGAFIYSLSLGRKS